MFNFFKKDKADDNYTYSQNSSYSNDEGDEDDYDDDRLLTNEEIAKATYIYYKNYIEGLYEKEKVEIITDSHLINNFYNHLKNVLFGTTLKSLDLYGSSMFIDMEDNEEEEYYDLSDLQEEKDIIQLAKMNSNFDREGYDCRDMDCEKCPYYDDCDDMDEFSLDDSYKAVILLAHFKKANIIKPVLIFTNEDEVNFSIEYFFINEFRYFYNNYNK